MKMQTSTDRIWLEDADGQEMAYVSFPARGENAVTIRSTVVHPSLRGQGVAGTLLDALAQELRRRGVRAVPICSYAVGWFSRHPEAADLLLSDAAPSQGGPL